MATTANYQTIIPDVLGNVCKYSGIKECARIARISRLGFSVAAPRIWVTLNSVQPLLMLLSPEVQERNTHITIKLLPFSTQAFERFDHYSPFVRSLTFSNKWKLPSNKELLFRLYTWSPLVQRVQLGPLLSNLAELRCSGQYTSGELPLWLSAFVSPSLKALSAYMSGPSKMVVLKDTAPTLALLARTCPALKRLVHCFSLAEIDLHYELYNDPNYDQQFDDESYYSDDEDEAFASLLLLPVVYGHLRTFQQLAYLSIMGWFINPESLVIISQLPLLECLGIMNRGWGMSQAFRDAPLGSDSFPALTRLLINLSMLEDFSAVLGATTLANGVRNLTITAEGIFDGSSLFSEDILNLILPLISKKFPKIWSLTLNGRLEESFSPEFKGVAWTRMSQLPISHLELHNFDADNLSMEEGLPLFPKLKTLKIPQQNTTLNHFTRLCQLPKLENLTIKKISFSNLPRELDLGGASPLQKIRIDEELEERVLIGSPDKVARFLISAWPKLQRLEYKTKDVAQEGLDLLNLHIQVIQGVIETKNNISSRFGPDVASSLLSRRLSSI